MTIKIMSKPALIGATAMALACGIAGYAWREEHRKPILEVYVFNLKSGSSVFIRTPDDKRILVDGGANSEVIRELTDILPFYSRRIDIVIATDADDKDVSGLIDVLERYSVDKVVVPAVTLQSLGLASTTDQIYSMFLDTVKRLNVPIQEVSAGDVLDFGQKIGGQPVKADILFPVAINIDHSANSDSKLVASSAQTIDPNAYAQMSSKKSVFQYSKASAPEIIMRITYGQTSVLLLGNATVKIQKFLISSDSATSSKLQAAKDSDVGDKADQENMFADVLVVPHSALASSFSSELMNKMKPDYLIYSQAIIAATKKSASTNNSTASSSKKKIVDPLYFIEDGKRVNLKEKGTVKIESDGITLKVADK